MERFPMIGVTLESDFILNPPPIVQKIVVSGNRTAFKPTIENSLTICTQRNRMFQDSLGKVIKINTVEEFDEFSHRLLTRPLILDSWLKRTHKENYGIATVHRIAYANLIITVNMAHPTIKSQLLKALNEAREYMVEGRRFSLEISLQDVMKDWFSNKFRGYGSVINTTYRTKYGRFVITNCSDFSECFEVNEYSALAAIFFPPYGLLLCPAYRIGRYLSTKDWTCHLQGAVSELSFQPRSSTSAILMNLIRQGRVRVRASDPQSTVPTTGAGMPPPQAPPTAGVWHTPPPGYMSGPTMPPPQAPPPAGDCHTPPQGYMTSPTTVQPTASSHPIHYDLTTDGDDQLLVP